jgi:hypothetical protein
MINFPRSGISTQLPQDSLTWPAFQDLYGSSQEIRQFITVRVVGGTPQLDVPVAKPVVDVACFATKPTSNKPPWFAAAQTMELIRLATYNRTLGQFGRALTIGAGNVNYNSARVNQACMYTEPRQLFGDARNYAIYSADLRLTWVEIGYVLQ